MQRAGEGAVRWCAVAAMAALLVAGCGEVVKVTTDGAIDDDDAGVTNDDAGVDDGDPCNGPRVEAEDFFECFTKARCERSVRCQGAFTDVEQCLEVGPQLGEFGFGLALTRALVVDSLEAGTVEIDPALMFECLESMAGASCATDESGGGEACELALRGLVEPGGTCFQELECVDGGECESSACGFNVCCQGTCGRAAGDGESCVEQSCATGLQCVDGSCSTGEVGRPCFDYNDCDFGLYCDASSRCQTRGGEGSACNTDEMCEGDLQCVGGSCARVSKEGDSCDDTCFGPLYCDPGDQRCATLPGPGARCDVSNGRCLGFDVLCDSSQTCRPAPAEGEPCINGRCGLGLYCLEIDAATRMCEPRKAVGESCTGSNQCETHFCGPNGTCEELPECHGDG